MNRDEYNVLFHKVGLNRVAFKAVNDCDEEILVLVNEAIAEEREACAKVADDGRFLHDDSPEAKFGKACAAAIRARGQV